MQDTPGDKPAALPVKDANDALDALGAMAGGSSEAGTSNPAAQLQVTPPAPAPAPAPKPKMPKKDQGLVAGALIIQVLAIGAIVIEHDAPDLVVVIESLAIAAATYLIGLASSLNPKVWNLILTLLNAAIIATGWFLATHPH